MGDAWEPQQEVKGEVKMKANGLAVKRAPQKAIVQTLWGACFYAEDGVVETAGCHYSSRADAEKDVREYPGTFLAKISFERVPSQKR